MCLPTRRPGVRARPRSSSTEGAGASSIWSGVRIYRARFARSYPTEAEILERIRTVRREHLAAAPGAALDVLYVATNADARWVAALRAPLLRDGWRAVVSLHDFALDEAQNEVGNAVDMEVARRAALFVGNGVRARSAVVAPS
jgi:hypothetical protein